MARKARVIAFYLPQFHPIPENDEWWGKGFTEWTNVGKAKPLFKGHDQPRVPTDLGYYDLRLPIVREQQAEMAREAGVEGFCYWHYWFGNGKRLMADIFDEVLESGKPDFPFCLGWANHSWYSKLWNSDGSSTNKLLIEQTYPGEEDVKLHINFLLKAFNDPRYIKVEGKPLLYIFQPLDVPDYYLESIRVAVRNAGFPDVYMVGRAKVPDNSREEILQKGMDAVSFDRLAGVVTNKVLANMGRCGIRIHNRLKMIEGFIKHRPTRSVDYSTYYHYLVNEEDKREDVIPNIVPQWDHTPRSGWNGSLFLNATPEVFYKHAKEAIQAVENKKAELQLIFLKSWNEWGEGNMMEPDLTYGRAFIEKLSQALNEQKTVD